MESFTFRDNEAVKGAVQSPSLAFILIPWYLLQYSHTDTQWDGLKREESTVSISLGLVDSLQDSHKNSLKSHLSTDKLGSYAHVLTSGIRKTFRFMKLGPHHPHCIRVLSCFSGYFHWLD